MLFDNIVIRLLGSDDFSAASKQQAAVDLTAAAGTVSCRCRLAHQFPWSVPQQPMTSSTRVSVTASCLPSPTTDSPAEH